MFVVSVLLRYVRDLWSRNLYSSQNDQWQHYMKCTNTLQPDVVEY